MKTSIKNLDQLQARKQELKQKITKESPRQVVQISSGLFRSSAKKDSAEALSSSSSSQALEMGVREVLSFLSGLLISRFRWGKKTSWLLSFMVLLVSPYIVRKMKRK